MIARLVNIDKATGAPLSAERHARTLWIYHVELHTGLWTYITCMHLS
jgi:hypothetical protein